jgi:glycosyltransferase involved in cell wall biosynthesis
MQLEAKATVHGDIGRKRPDGIAVCRCTRATASEWYDSIGPVDSRWNILGETDEATQTWQQPRAARSKVRAARNDLLLTATRRVSRAYFAIGAAVRRTDLIILSPSVRGGSWRWIEEVVGECGGGLQQRATVIAYGRHRVRGNSLGRTLSLPFIPYEKVGLWLSSHPAFLLVYNAPLALWCQLLLWLLRPRVVMANGVLLSAVATPYAWLTGAKLFLAYHAYAGHYPRSIQRCLALVLHEVDCGFVNSTGSERDLSSLLGSRRVIRVEHWADEIYFAQARPPRPATKVLTILYVGRLDGEKVGFLLKVVRSCKDLPVKFQFAGAGPFAAEVSSLSATHNVEFFGYLNDKRTLATLYAEADIVWAVADDTYLAKPGVEALATGTPLIVPDVPAVHVRASAGIRVPRDLVPPSVAWIVDGEDVAASRELIAEMISSPPARSIECREFAREHYSHANVVPVARLLMGAIRGGCN